MQQTYIFGEFLKPTKSDQEQEILIHQERRWHLVAS